MGTSRERVNPAIQESQLKKKKSARAFGVALKEKRGVE